MAYLIDFVLHIDSHLVTIVNTFGNWTYLILFAIIFIETGAVIMPFFLATHCFSPHAQWRQTPITTLISGFL